MADRELDSISAIVQLDYERQPVLSEPTDGDPPGCEEQLREADSFARASIWIAAVEISLSIVAIPVITFVVRLCPLIDIGCCILIVAAIVGIIDAIISLTTAGRSRWAVFGLPLNLLAMVVICLAAGNI